MVHNIKARHKWYRVLVLGLCIYFFPVLFERLGNQWYPKNGKGENWLGDISNANLVRKRFWQAAIWIFIVIALALLVSMALGHPTPDGWEWLRLFAVFVALLAALGRGGWLIQTWKDDTVIERVDRAMYRAGQLGAAVLLILIMTAE